VLRFVNVTTEGFGLAAGRANFATAWLRHGDEVLPCRSLAPRSVKFAKELVQFFFRSFTLNTVFLLELTYELVSFPVKDIQFVIGEFTPMFSYLAFDLFPIPFDLVPIHFSFPFLGS
jgi:hypothetical protein